ncbi:hypothetical protein PJL18_00535 [Paenarthrobacter nicotinovorans]|nr:hypothetical protein [Paenarthrobacter nicotinovorans]
MERCHPGLVFPCGMGEAEEAASANKPQLRSAVFTH